MREDPYLEARVMTASPHQLHQMVVDGTIRHVRRAIASLEGRDLESACTALEAGREFLTELIGGLDANVAPELVAQVKSLFLFAYARLVDAGLRHDPQPAADALRILEIHRDTWAEVGQRLRTEAGLEPVAAGGRDWTT
jgi:flagellar protein FliS